MKKVVIITMMATICSLANAQKNNAFAMIRLKSKDAQYNGKLIYRLTYSEFSQSAAKNVYSKVYSYVLAVDSLSLNKLRDAIQGKLKTYGSNINKTQVITSIEQLATDNALKQLMNNANVFRVNEFGSISNFDGSAGSFISNSSNALSGGASPGSMPAFLYNQLFNMANQINDPTKFAMDNPTGSSTDATYKHKDGSATEVSITQTKGILGGITTYTTFTEKDANGNTTHTDRIEGDYRQDSQTNLPVDPSSGMAVASTGGAAKLPAPDDGTISNPAQYLQFILGSKLFSAMAKQLFTSLEIKFGGAIDAPDKGTTIEQELAFEATMMAHFFNSTKTGIEARRTANDGTAFDPTYVSGAVEISFNSNLGTIDPAQIATIASLKVNGNAIFLK